MQSLWRDDFTKSDGPKGDVEHQKRKESNFVSNRSSRSANYDKQDGNHRRTWQFTPIFKSRPDSNFGVDADQNEVQV
jgi:hypothetical protein